MHKMIICFGSKPADNINTNTIYILKQTFGTDLINVGGVTPSPPRHTHVPNVYPCWGLNVEQYFKMISLGLMC